MAIKTEICIDSYAGAKIAADLGYTSVEINSALDLGGLTPSLGLVREICNNLKIEKNCMLRPRGGGFCYTASEYETMLDDLDILCQEKIDGIVFGFLTADYHVDIARTTEMITRIHQAGLKAIFHRAFDNTIDPKQAIETLIQLRADRLLTSGQAGTAIEGADLLAKLQAEYGQEIELVAGAGVKAKNALQLLQKTKVNYIHSSCRVQATDVTSKLNVSYAIYKDYPTNYLCTDYASAEALRAVVADYQS